MTSGLRSRRLAHAIVTNLPHDLQPVREDLRAWLASKGIAEWRERYNASPPEVLDLLDFTRVRTRSLLKTLLETGTVTVDLPTARVISDREQPLTLEPARGEPAPAPLAVYARDELVSVIAAEDYSDIRAILDTGLALTLGINYRPGEATLQVELTTADDET